VASPGWTFTTASGANSGGGMMGAPYSAEEVTETIQTLADGTHISQPAPKVKFYRDSQGRTRAERTFPLPAGVSAAAWRSGTDQKPPVCLTRFDPYATVRVTRFSQFSVSL